MSISVPALKVQQWLPEWDAFDYNQPHASKPKKYFYIFTMKASQLRALSGVNRRGLDVTDRAKDLGIQRRHDESRSNEIKDFIKYGYPFSELSKAKKSSDDSEYLRKPGWLPTAIIVNIVEKEQAERQGKEINPADIITISEGENIKINFPISETGWSPQNYPPIEVIDGQHRLWAFEADNELDYELPVVAFHGLGISWQAYLFWVINIKPKRITPSLAYDLYPLLRHQSWLDAPGNIHVYREARAQEIVGSLWSLQASPWYRRINMLAEGGRDKGINQASWIRALTASLFKRGGAFEDERFNLSAADQVALIIFFGNQLKLELGQINSDWKDKLRARIPEDVRAKLEKDALQPEFYSAYTLVSTDQGVRVILQILNDVFTHISDNQGWTLLNGGDASDPEAVSEALIGLGASRVGEILSELAKALASFDWRTSGGVNQKDEKEIFNLKMGFRGAAGYKHLRNIVSTHILEKVRSPQLSQILSSIQPEQ